MKFAGLAAILQEEEEGNQRGGGGLLIGMSRRRNGQALNGIEEEVTAGSGGFRFSEEKRFRGRRT
jgi:hypothetical protein